MWFNLFLTVQQLTTQKIQAVTFWPDSCGRAARQANRIWDRRMPEVAYRCLQNKNERLVLGAPVEWVFQCHGFQFKSISLPTILSSSLVWILRLKVVSLCIF